LRFTQDAPDANYIADFYRSEDYISHTDTKKGFINRLYHIVRNRTIAAKMRFIRKCTNLQTGKLLDIGAGTGAFLQYAKQSGWDVTGLRTRPNGEEQGKRIISVGSVGWRRAV
jgi:2-polyprenyl-3-methyl-5-hydroxy-6-metoxy-1,4-benzoquinol methylase